MEHTPAQQIFPGLQQYWVPQHTGVVEGQHLVRLQDVPPDPHPSSRTCSGVRSIREAVETFQVGTTFLKLRGSAESIGLLKASIKEINPKISKTTIAIDFIGFYVFQR